MNVDFSKLDRAFNPRCVAIVGDKKETNYNWIRSHKDFAGKLYSVQVDPKEIEGITALGVTNYASLMDIPETVDLAIVAVPRNIAPRILEDCIRKEVSAAHFYTAGFSETNTEEGIKLEKMLIEKAERAQFHLVGPNCMGVFNPSISLGLRAAGNPSAPGKVGFISQSGMHAVSFIREATLHGVNVNKCVSFGNGIVLDATSYLQYFGQDPEIKAIGMFVEGVKNGAKFLEVLKEVSARKPVVIWKGGRTDAGKRTSSGHSGSTSVSQAVWDAAVKEHGGVKASSMDEVIDALKAFVYLPTVRGDGVGITGGTGGQSVATADVFAEAGLQVPTLTDKSMEEMGSFFTLIGGSYRNPVDTGNPNGKRMRRILEILVQDDNIDNLALLMGARVPAPANATASTPAAAPTETPMDALIAVKKTTAKPVMAILSWSFSPPQVQAALDMMGKLQSEGIPVFLSAERCAAALRKACDHYGWRSKVSGRGNHRNK